MRRSPLFAVCAGGTIGLGLGILCSAFTIVNAYLIKERLAPFALSAAYAICVICGYAGVTGFGIRTRARTR